MSKAPTPKWIPQNEQAAKEPVNPITQEKTAEQIAVEQQIAAMAEQSNPHVDNEQPQYINVEDEANAKMDAMMERSRKVFTEQPVPTSPFNRMKPAAPELKQPEMFEVPEGTPSWGEFAKFICEYGDLIEQAEYPNPSGTVVDTLWKGVPVKNARHARIKHVREGWVDWRDCK